MAAAREASGRKGRPKKAGGAFGGMTYHHGLLAPEGRSTHLANAPGAKDCDFHGQDRLKVADLDFAREKRPVGAI
jgi:hypothetical protein